MKSLLGTKLRKKADKPEDTVLIFFAGHGAPEEDPGSDDRDGITKYILAYNSDPEDLYSTAIPMNEIARIFSRIKAQRVIFIADSCYSGGSGGRTILTPGWRANISDSFLDRIARAGKGSFRCQARPSVLLDQVFCPRGSLPSGDAAPWPVRWTRKDQQPDLVPLFVPR